MRIPVYGKTKDECLKEIARKEQVGFIKVMEPKVDTSYFKVRWVCLMDKPGHTSQKQKWNNYLSNY